MDHFNKWYILAQELEKSGNLQRDVKESGYFQPGVCKINTKSIRQLSYFNFRWKNRVPAYCILFHNFKGYQCNKSNEINPTKRFSLEPEKTTFKRNEDFTCVFSIPVKFIWDLFSWSSVRNCLWCYYRSLITSIALEKCKKECDIT